MLSPAAQTFTKTDVAKFEHSWEQLPHLVSLGAEKNFREFMLRLTDRRVVPDASYFERLVAKAILFRRTEKIVSDFKFGGYRANIVTYSIAKLSNATANRVDLAAIWKAQRISEATDAAIASIAPLVQRVIVEPSGRVRHIGEWCKKNECWAAVKELEWSPPTTLKNELVQLHAGKAEGQPLDLGLATPTTGELELIASASQVEAEVWFALSNWAKETGNLQGWQRSLAYSLGRVATAGRMPSMKQAKQGLKMLEEGRRLGFG